MHTRFGSKSVNVQKCFAKPSVKLHILPIKFRDMSEEILKCCISELLSKGCSCHVDIKVFFKIVTESLHSLTTDDPNVEKSLLSLSILNHLIRSVFFKPSEKGSTDCCRNNVQILQILRKTKFSLLPILLQVCELHPSSVISHQSLRLFLNILRFLPCQETSELSCESCCQQITFYFVRNVLSKPENFHILREILNESDSQPRLRTKNACKNTIRSRVIYPSIHDENMRKNLVSQIKSEWKKWTANKDLENPDLLKLWRKLVSIKSNLGVNSCNESIISSSSLVKDVCRAKTCDNIWLMKVGILNEVLCYGSTLSLQSDVPDELCHIAQEIIKEMVQDKMNLDCVTSKVFFLGDMTEETHETEQHLDRGSVQAFSLLVLKSIALVIRQATSCSSGEESDGSHCSRGSLCDLESDMIEKNMTKALESWINWLKLTVGRSDPDLSAEDSFMEIFMSVFMEQDDVLIEALLCLLDIYVGMNALNNSGSEEECDFQPILLFECFMDKCGWDASVLVDYLLSNETCFLLYLLRFLKFLAKQSSFKSNQLGKLLQEMQCSLQKLSKGGLFPYDVKPILSLLSKINT